MKPGDLVRVNLKAFNPDALKLNGMLGIILKPEKRGPLDVWRIILQNGTTLSLQPVSLEVIQ
jgi:hypothetical protein